MGKAFALPQGVIFRPVLGRLLRADGDDVAGFLFGGLAFPHGGIAPAPGQKLFMRALFDNLARLVAARQAMAAQ